jgi:xanthine dehydrogenase accessory factor
MRDPAAQGLAAIKAGEPTAMVAILAAEGSTPRAAGTRMFVTQRQVIGTIGGGNLEYQSIRQARAILASQPGDWRVQDYPLGPLLGQCCGGRVRLLVEHLNPAKTDWLAGLATLAGRHIEHRFGAGAIERTLVDRSDGPGFSARGLAPQAGDRFAEPVGCGQTPLSMFGAGHVGQALAKLLADLPYDLNWCDNREELAGIADLAILDAETMVDQAQAATGAVLILTHDHALDFRLTAAALQGRASFVGLIGSATKRARFLSRLRQAGLGDAALSRLVCPIGLAGIRGKEPSVIAIAVAAQLLTLFPQPVEDPAVAVLQGDSGRAT